MVERAGNTERALLVTISGFSDLPVGWEREEE